MKKKRMDKEAIVYAVLAIGCFFLFWWFITTFTPAKETTPGPWPVLQLLVQSFTEPIGTYTIIGHLMISLRRVLVGFGVATVLGIILGIAMGTSDWARAIIKPIFELLRPIPPIAWIPLVILFFGVGETPKYILTGIGAFTNVTLNAYTAAQNVDPELIGCRQNAGHQRARHLLPRDPALLLAADLCGHAGGPFHQLDGRSGRRNDRRPRRLRLDDHARQ